MFVSRSRKLAKEHQQWKLSHAEVKRNRVPEGHSSAYGHLYPSQMSCLWCLYSAPWHRKKESSWHRSNSRTWGSTEMPWKHCIWASLPCWELPVCVAVKTIPVLPSGAAYFCVVPHKLTHVAASSESPHSNLWGHLWCAGIPTPIIWITPWAADLLEGCGTYSLWSCKVEIRDIFSSSLLY